jgi:ubiquitin-conjugating enzyme E2 Q
MIPPTHAISNAMNSSSSNSPSRATRNVSIVEGGVGGTTTTGHSSPSTVGEDATVGPLAGRTAVIPAEEGDLSRQQAISVAVLEEAIPAASVDHTSGATDAEGGGVTENDGDEANEEEDDGSEYSYTYEDEDETHYSGFLIPTDNPFDTAAAAASGEAVVAETGDDSLTSGTHVNSISRTNSRVSDGGGRSTPATVPETNPQEKDLKQKWREPTRAAVDMSLRAEKEKTGGKRRLASDLYKIMMADTSEAGFSLEPADEDSMEKWRIKLFDFDADSNLAKDLLVCGLNHVELEMSFPDQYPFEPPFVRVVQPRFKRQTGFVMSGALCMELLTKDGWNPVNDIESVIVSIRSIMAIGDGRLQAATELPKEEYKKVLAEATLKSKAKEEVKSEEKEEDDDAVDGDREAKRKRVPSEADEIEPEPKESSGPKRVTGGSYTASEAKTAYQHLSKYHEKEGWDKSGWWARKG